MLLNKLLKPHISIDKNNKDKLQVLQQPLVQDLLEAEVGGGSAGGGGGRRTAVPEEAMEILSLERLLLT
jgi:hypothetical protein